MNHCAKVCAIRDKILFEEMIAIHKKECPFLMKPESRPGYARHSL